MWWTALVLVWHMFQMAKADEKLGTNSVTNVEPMVKPTASNRIQLHCRKHNV